MRESRIADNSAVKMDDEGGSFLHMEPELWTTAEATAVLFLEPSVKI